MAFSAIQWAMKQQLHHTKKLLLIVLADYAEKENWTAFPSYKTLAQVCGVSRRTVIRTVKQLEATGHILLEERIREGGGSSSCMIKLNPEAPVTESHPPQCHEVTPLVTQSHPPSDTESPRLIEEPVKEPTKEPRVSEKQCEEVYQAYPRKKGRGAALKAIRKAIKDFGFEKLKAAVEAFAAEWKQRQLNGDDLKFCPWPQKWFNEQRYRDEPDEVVAPVAGSAPAASMSVWELKQLRDTLQEDARKIRLRFFVDEAHFSQWDSEEKRKEYLALRERVDGINKQLMDMAGSGQSKPEEALRGPLAGLVKNVARKAKGGR